MIINNLTFEHKYELNPFIGKDGKPYYSRAALSQANAEWTQRANPYIGKDGKPYYSVEALSQANAEWTEKMFPKKEE